MLLVSAFLFVATVAARAVSINRHVRSRLWLSAVLFLLHAGATAALRELPLSATFAGQVRVALPLLFAFALINVAVTLALNPWGGRPASDRFPKIVQDAIVIALFALAAGLVLQEKIFVTGAAAAVVVGFALQETLGNLFAGLAIQIEKPFRVGHWVTVNNRDGLVVEITWRATKIRTRAGNLVVVPNSVLARDTIVNYSEPAAETRVDVDIPVSYATPPNDVKSALLSVFGAEEMFARSPAPDVLVWDLTPTHVVYRVSAWVSDFALFDRARDRIRSLARYEFERRGMLPPYPMQIYHTVDTLTPARPPAELARLTTVVRSVDIFQPLSDEECAALVQSAGVRLYAAGEAVVHEGETGSSMFIVCRGEASVRIGQPAREVARLGVGQYFGEMSLLTGEPRSAAVAALTDCELLEITAEEFRRVVLADPMLVDRIGVAVSSRLAMLEAERAALQGAAAASDAPRSLLSRVRQFLRL